MVAVGDDEGGDVGADLGQGGAEALGLGHGDEAVDVAVEEQRRAGGVGGLGDGVGVLPGLDDRRIAGVGEAAVVALGLQGVAVVVAVEADKAGHVVGHPGPQVVAGEPRVAGGDVGLGGETGPGRAAVEQDPLGVIAQGPGLQAGPLDGGLHVLFGAGIDRLGRAVTQQRVVDGEGHEPLLPVPVRPLRHRRPVAAVAAAAVDEDDGTAGGGPGRPAEIGLVGLGGGAGGVGHHAAPAPGYLRGRDAPPGLGSGGGGCRGGRGGLGVRRWPEGDAGHGQQGDEGQGPHPGADTVLRRHPLSIGIRAAGLSREPLRTGA